MITADFLSGTSLPPITPPTGNALVLVCNTPRVACNICVLLCYTHVLVCNTLETCRLLVCNALVQGCYTHIVECNICVLYVY